MPVKLPLRMGNAEFQRGFGPSRCTGSVGILLGWSEDRISPFQTLLNEDQQCLQGCGCGSWYFPSEPYMVPVAPTPIAVS